ncbi:MAG TPA: c-type cytochrome biogenesis protein CcsB [Dehalococcoidia bacterium]|nr:c-type cytochrome biogenesis protein CcsB [Dehalococcoidia bacterium]
MEQLSVDLFWAGLITSALATVCYAVYAFGARVSYGAAETGAGTVTVPIVQRAPQSLGTAGSFFAAATALLLLISLIARVIAAGRPPYTNLWEFTVAFAFGVTVAYIAFERWYGQRSLGVFTLPLAFGLLLISALFFPAEINPLIPALQANRILAFHVGTMIAAYSALSVSFGAGVMYLLQGGRRRFKSLPRGSLLEEIGYRSVLVGFPLLAFGIALGAWWANDAWGRPWGWDPKETSALVTWLIYAGYLHMRGLKGWKGNRSAWMLCIGYGAVLFTYFGVNLWISGLHSYSGV